MQESPYERTVIIDKSPKTKSEIGIQNVQEEKKDGIYIDFSASFEKSLQIDYTYLERDRRKQNCKNAIIFVILIVQIVYIYSIVML